MHTRWSKINIKLNLVTDQVPCLFWTDAFVVLVEDDANAGTGNAIKLNMKNNGE